MVSAGAQKNFTAWQDCHSACLNLDSTGVAQWFGCNSTQLQVPWQVLEHMSLEVPGSQTKSRADYFCRWFIRHHATDLKARFASGLRKRPNSQTSGSIITIGRQPGSYINKHSKSYNHEQTPLSITNTLNSTTPKLPCSNSKHQKTKTFAATDHSTPKCSHPCSSVARGPALAPCSAARWAKMMLSPSFGLRGGAQGLQFRIWVRQCQDVLSKTGGNGLAFSSRWVLEIRYAVP